MQRIYSKLNFTTKLFILILIITVIPGLFFQYFMQRSYEKRLIEEVSVGVLSLLEEQNSKLDNIFKQVEETSDLLRGNPDIFDIFKDYPSRSVSQTLADQRKIKSILASAYLHQDLVVDSYFYTEHWIYGQRNSNMRATIQNVNNTNWTEEAIIGKGKAVWLSAYNYGESINSTYLINKENYFYKYPITMVQLFSPQYSQDGLYYTMPKDVDPPILIVHLLESDIRKIFTENLPYNKTEFYLLNSDGKIVSTNNKMVNITDEAENYLKKTLGKTKMELLNLSDNQYLLCSSPSKRGNFTSNLLIPEEVLMSEATKELSTLKLLFYILYVGISLFFAIIISQYFSKPIKRLIEASKSISKGNFDITVKGADQYELNQLIIQFNKMTKKIKTLIHENYEIKLREKETQIQMLTVQINPHFLYNTLNTINLMAINNNDFKISSIIQSLSDMLHYTFNNYSEMSTIFNEINWTESYLKIMEIRYDNKFKYEFFIDSDLYHCLMPKMVLQPLVENSIIHGFNDETLFIGTDNKQDPLAFYKIEIHVTEENNQTIKISVFDNGIGIKREKLKILKNIIFDIENDVENSGIANIVKRLHLIYGDSYDFNIESELKKGTHITIIIPKKYNTNL